MRTSIFKVGWLIPLLFASALFAVTGCRTGADSENVSARPWDAPQGWETGALPSSMNQQR